MITLHMEYMSERKLIIDGPTAVPCYIHLYYMVQYMHTNFGYKQRKDSRKDAKLWTYSQDAQFSLMYILNFLSN